MYVIVLIFNMIITIANSSTRNMNRLFLIRIRLTRLLVIVGCRYPAL